MDLIKKLTGKNQKNYEQAAAHIVDGADVKSFKELVSKEDFLFDFIKQNVAKRLKNACNKHNYQNLIEFLKYYSPSYDNFNPCSIDNRVFSPFFIKSLILPYCANSVTMHILVGINTAP